VNPLPVFANPASCGPSLWSFFGVRKGSEFQEDIARVSMMHLIVIGIGAGFLFVIGLMLFVRWVVAH
jgi:Protein of unknown function (DUF2970)